MAPLNSEQKRRERINADRQRKAAAQLQRAIGVKAKQRRQAGTVRQMANDTTQPEPEPVAEPVVAIVVQPEPEPVAPEVVPEPDKFLLLLDELKTLYLEQRDAV